MRSAKLFSLAALAAGISAQSVSISGFSTPTFSTSAPSASSTNLAGLIAQIPSCAYGCIESSAKNINCGAADFKCLCSNSANLVTSLGTCIVVSSGCSQSDQSKAANVASQICTQVNTANPSDIAAASSAATSALGTAAATSSHGNSAPARTDVAMGVMGVAGMAGALAAFAL